MSSTLRPPPEPPTHSQRLNSILDTHYQPSSSPQQQLASSSSPPTTPYAARHTYDYAHIKSSPRFGLGLEFRAPKDSYEDSHNIWSWPQLPPQTPLKSQVHLVPFLPRSPSMASKRLNIAFGDNTYHPPTMDADSENSRSKLPAHKAPLHPAANSPDLVDDDQQYDGSGFSFSELGIHTMCFRTSAERGRWKTDPMPYKKPSFLPTRKSAPVTNSVTRVPPVSRLISEPAPPTSTSVPNFQPEVNEPSDLAVPEVTSAPSPVVLPSLPTSPIMGSMETLPPLTSDRDSSMDADDILTPSSPLPPSSPPPLSPVPSPALLPARLTWLDFSVPSSPLPVPSSPLSPILSDIGEEDMQDMQDMALVQDPFAEQIDGEGLDQDGASVTPNPGLTPTSHDRLACVSLEPSIIEFNAPQSELQKAQSTMPSLPSALSSSLDEASRDMVATPTVAPSSPRFPAITPFDESVAGNSGESSRTTALAVKDAVSRRRSTSKELGKENQDKTKENIEPSKDNHSSGSTTAIDGSASSKKRLKSKEAGSNDGPVRKRVKLADGSARSTSVPLSSTVPQGEKAKKRRKEPAVSERKSKSVHDASDHSASSSPAPSTSRLRPDRNGIAEEDNEICGMIIEGMATSRASSLTVSSIYRIVMQSRPTMKAEKTEADWRIVFDRVLNSGVMGQGSGVFGKVDSSYKDGDDRSVEARWFYVPEMDCDQERAALIRSMMPRPGKRSETKKYKQYYYQPLDKISRWDPEDDP